MCAVVILRDAAGDGSEFPAAYEGSRGATKDRHYGRCGDGGGWEMGDFDLASLTLTMI